VAALGELHALRKAGPRDRETMNPEAHKPVDMFLAGDPVTMRQAI
jgi:hypothetical protein